MTHEIRFQANPTQKLFIESRAEADLFDCRKGEGKSAAIAWACFFHTLHNPGAEWLIIRDTWENCRRTTQREFFEWFRPDSGIGEYRSGNKEFVWTAERIGLKGRVTFIGLDDAQDAGKVASMPLGAFAIDEPSGAAESSSGVAEFIFDTAFAQLRQPGMQWYAVKLAQNNPDESHWTYRRFWDPGTPNLRPVDAAPPLQEPGFRPWQTTTPENQHNLPPGYYEAMASMWSDRPDLVRRFVEGKHGFQQVGNAVTPEWVDALHLTPALKPVKGVDLQLCWDGGLNPTCIITQVTPLGDWLILEALTGSEIGAFELITDVVKPALAMRYKGFNIRHIGDPALRQREQSSSAQSAARLIQRELGGPFIPAPVREEARTEPLRAVLRKVREGRGIVQVDKERAKAVWFALRGGWHYHVARSGVVGNIVKDEHSHVGDSLGYGAAVLFPLGEIQKRRKAKRAQTASYFDSAPGGGLGFEQPGTHLPPETRRIGK